MNTWICLLRGINVGGKHRLAMQDLRTLLEDLGLTNVKTYIQSGNIVFQSATENPHSLAQSIQQGIEQSHGFAPQVLLLTKAYFQQAIDANPYPEAAAEPKTLHLFFLTAPAENPDLAKLEQLKTATERFTLLNDVFYLHAPDGIGRSKLAEKVEQALGVAATARNWRSVCKIMELVDQVDS